MRIAVFAIAVCLLPVSTVSGQAVPMPPVPVLDASAYTPQHRLPKGRQVVVVYVGLTGCGYSRDQELKTAVRSMKPHLARQSAAQGAALSINGVALDWEPDSGFAYLRSLGAWDEMTVGNNWINSGAQHHIWQDAAGRPSVPQVIVYERTVNSDKRIAFTGQRRVAQFVGLDEIVNWVKAGAPLPANPARTPNRRSGVRAG